MSISETLSADGQTGEFIAQGDFRIHVEGDFGGGTLSVQEKINGTFELLVGTERLVDFDELFDSAGIGGIFRFNLSGSTSPTLNTTVSGPVSKDAIF